MFLLLAWLQHVGKMLQRFLGLYLLLWIVGMLDQLRSQSKLQTPVMAGVSYATFWELHRLLGECSLAARWHFSR
jgi:uncharacterized membrane protein